MIFKKILEERLSAEIESIAPLSGGDINEVYKINCTLGKFVIKHNSCQRFPKMFHKEANGLHMLRKGGLKTPAVIDHFEYEDDQFLILEFIKEEKAENNFWIEFANSLAKIHRKSNALFGLDHNNYIGSLDQQNDPMSSWEEFFISRRLKPLVKIAFDNGLMARKHLADFNHFYRVFSELLPVETPSLLHGDLWSGNLLCGLGQQAVFIDPAVYYGHREVDIAMTKMFGGFDQVYLDHYQDCFPLEKGWEERVSIHNLYPRLVHLVLFGRSYLSGIENVIQRYT